MNMNFLLTVTLSFAFKQMMGGCQTAHDVNFKFEEAWQESKILGKQSG